MKKNTLVIVGETTSKTKVVSGVFKLFDTNGLPLVVLFQNLKDNNMIASPIHFVDEARAAGWSDKTISLRLSEALNDVYGKPHADVVMSRLNLKK
jgi:hypothetical protein